MTAAEIRELHKYKSTDGGRTRYVSDDVEFIVAREAAAQLSEINALLREHFGRTIKESEQQSTPRKRG